jgi:hypothetical protein
MMLRFDYYALLISAKKAEVSIGLMPLIELTGAF